MQVKPLFDNARYCKGCGRIMVESYTKDFCSTCEASRIFDDVREYIRSSEVNEYDVAKHFDIPVGMVQQWIKEGRIEYKERDQKTIMDTFCQRCGARITFGTLCQKCLKTMNEERKGYVVHPAMSDGEEKLRYLENVEK